MKVGTKSVLFGAHQFILHPFFLWLAWWKLYYLTFQPAILVAMVVHDLGYIGRGDMDGEEGKLHPGFGALLMGRLFDVPYGEREWYNFTAGHSRFYARLIGIEVSMLMRADKYATCLVPLPLYLALVLASGECWEYVQYHADYHHKQLTGMKWFDLIHWAVDVRRQWREDYGPL